MIILQNGIQLMLLSGEKITNRETFWRKLILFWPDACSGKQFCRRRLLPCLCQGSLIDSDFRTHPVTSPLAPEFSLPLYKSFLPVIAMKVD
jgi:hypothetical protein